MMNRLEFAARLLEIEGVSTLTRSYSLRRDCDREALQELLKLRRLINDLLDQTLAPSETQLFVAR